MPENDNEETTSQYDDLLCRASLADTGTVPRTPPLEESPDVIPVGSSGVDDPAVYFTETYDQNVAKPVVADENNLIYVRGRNLGEAAQNGDVYVYWARAEELNDPSRWKGNQLLTEDGHGSFRVTDVEPQAVAVATTPFTWTPDASLADTDVVLLGVLSTNDHPNPVPALRSPLDFKRWISRRGGVGALRTTVIAKPKPETKVTLTGELKFAEGGLADLLITATDIPAGTYVSLKLSTPVEGKIISIDPTKITQNPQTVGIQAQLPANYTAQMESKVALPPDGVPGPNNSVSVRAQYTPPPEGGGPVKPVLLARYSVKFDR